MDRPDRIMLTGVIISITSMIPIYFKYYYFSMTQLSIGLIICTYAIYLINNNPKY